MGDVDHGLREVYNSNAPLILEPHNAGPIRSVHNFPVDNTINIDQIMAYAEEVYAREQTAFYKTERRGNTDISYLTTITGYLNTHSTYHVGVTYSDSVCAYSTKIL